MATASIPDQLAAWALLPLIGGLGALLLRRVEKPEIQAMSVMAASVLLLGLLLVVWFEEAEILGLAFTPPTWEAGIMMLLGAVSFAIIAACNRVRKNNVESLLVRRLSRAGGVVFAVLTILFALAADGVWSTWPIMLLYLMALSYTGMSLYASFQERPSYGLLSNVSVLGWAMVGWAGLSMIIGQLIADDPYVGYVLQAGGGFGHVVMSVIKVYLIYFSSAYLLAFGISALLEIKFGNQ